MVMHWIFSIVAEMMHSVEVNNKTKRNKIIKTMEECLILTQVTHLAHSRLLNLANNNKNSLLSLRNLSSNRT